MPNKVLYAVAKVASLDILDILKKSLPTMKFLFIEVFDKLMILWDYPNRHWTVAYVMAKKEQSLIHKRKHTTGNKKNARKFELEWKQNWLLLTKGHGLTRIFSGREK